MRLSGKIEGHKREAVEYSSMLKTCTMPASLKNGPQYLKSIFNNYAWLKVQCKKCKSFLLCTVYRPPDAPIDFLENLSERFVDYLLHGSNVIIMGDLNCNRIGSDREGHVLSDFCSTFGLSHFVKTATRVTGKSKSLIDVALTTNENILHACDVIQSAISDHSLVSLTLKLKTPRPRISFVTTRSYKNYDRHSFIEDLLTFLSI